MERKKKDRKTMPASSAFHEEAYGLDTKQPIKSTERPKIVCQVCRNIIHDSEQNQKNTKSLKHHAIYIPKTDQVIHYYGTQFLSSQKGSGKVAGIVISSFEEFLDGSNYYFVCDTPNNPQLTLARALVNIGRRGYHLTYENCEHFATYCVRGQPSSIQLSEKNPFIFFVSFSWGMAKKIFVSYNNFYIPDDEDIKICQNWLNDEKNKQLPNLN